VYQGGRNRRDSKHILWAFVFGSRIEPIWALSQLSLCTHTPTAQTTTVSRYLYNFFSGWPNGSEGTGTRPDYLAIRDDQKNATLEQHGNQIAGLSAVGVWEHTDSWLKTPIGASPRTTYQRSKIVIAVISIALSWGHFGPRLLELAAQSLIGSPRGPSIYLVSTIRQIIWPSPDTLQPIYDSRGVADLFASVVLSLFPKKTRYMTREGWQICSR